MAITIHPVINSQDLKAFVLYPHTLYRGNPFWVPNLIRDDLALLTPGKHPFHEHGEARHFLAVEEGRIAGRISAHINHLHNSFHGEKTGFFGFFECEESQETAALLLGAAEQFAREQGMDTLRGPFNYSTNETCGLLTNAYDEMPYLMMPWNFPYYEGLITGAGFHKAMDLLSYHLDDTLFSFERIGKLEERVAKKDGVTLRRVDFSRFREEIRTIQQIYNSAWEKNWGFVPMTDAEFEFMAKELRPIVNADLLWIGEIEGKAAGFALCLPDYNIVLKKMNGRLWPFGILKALWHKRNINRVRIITLGIIREFRLSGLDILMYSKIARSCLAMGIRHGELGWILENNRIMNRAAEGMGARVSKRYRIFEKSLCEGNIPEA